MLNLIGIGLNSKSVTLEALEVIKKSDYVFLENYTSVLDCSKEELEKIYGVKIELASRDLTEKDDEIVELSKKNIVSFLVVGDVFGATTHTDLFLRAKQANVEIVVYHNASILTAIGITGLELYKFGKTTSIVFPDDGWMPNTPYLVLKDNLEKGLHTLCLLDIKVSEPSKEDLLKENYVPKPSRFMSINEALKIMLELEEKNNLKLISKDTLVVGVARLGVRPLIKKGTIAELLEFDFKEPLHSLIIPGKLHFMEEDVLNYY